MLLRTTTPALPDSQTTPADASSLRYQQYALWLLVGLGVGFRLFH